MILNLLSKFLNYVPAKEREGLTLDMSGAWEIREVVADFHVFFRCLHTLLPDDCNVYLEGVSDPDISRWLEENTPARTAKIEVATIWPRPAMHHLAATRANLNELGRRANRLTTPYLIHHLAAYLDQTILVQWNDALGDPLYVSGTIDEDRIRDFCQKTDAHYTRLSVAPRPD